ncbi:MAG TPA: tripartite tricarboxylate transporter substrate binding protein [candidate division Zixibacteria bacterium]|nr:tripartite tricarboxylate transporter substrate binding protein [candidate division Zixibacteria bacterium]
MNKLNLGCIGAFTALLLWLASPERAGAQSDFYKGKQIRIIVGLSTGGGYDRAARLVARHIGKYIPGNPDVVVQNMPGAGSVTAANYVWSVAKPDGLTLLAPHNNVYLSQLSGQKEVRFDLVKFQWIGSLENDDMTIFGRADAPFKSIGDIIRSKEPPKCGSTGVGSSDYVMSKILEETIGAKVTHVTGYPGSSEIAIALERGEVACMGLTISTYFSREPFLTWHKNKFVRFLAQSGRKRDQRIAEAPTVYELMDEYKTPATKRRVAEAMLQGGEWARPLMAPPATPPDRVAVLRAAYDKVVKDPDLLAEAKKLRIVVTPNRGEELQKTAREVLSQPPEVIEQIKKLFVQ